MLLSKFLNDHPKKTIKMQTFAMMSQCQMTMLTWQWIRLMSKWKSNQYQNPESCTMTISCKRMQEGDIIQTYQQRICTAHTWWIRDLFNWISPSKTNVIIHHILSNHVINEILMLTDILINYRQTQETEDFKTL